MGDCIFMLADPYSVHKEKWQCASFSAGGEQHINLDTRPPITQL